MNEPSTFEFEPYGCRKRESASTSPTRRTPAHSSPTQNHNTHFTDNLTQQEPIQLTQHEQHRRERVKRHRPALPQHAHHDIRHQHEVQEGRRAGPHGGQDEERDGVQGGGRGGGAEGVRYGEGDVEGDVGRGGEEGGCEEVEWLWGEEGVG